jgi:formylglycine-generating enzyme required for sulfatase activity
VTGRARATLRLGLTALAAALLGETPGVGQSPPPPISGSPPARAPAQRDDRPSSPPAPLIPARAPRRRVLRAGEAPAREVAVMLPGGVPLELVRVAAGTSCLMGTAAGEREGSAWERPQHAVTVTHGFFIGRHEVTQGQWQAVMGVNPAHAYGVGFALPVYYVSWDDVTGPDGFLARLNLALGTRAFRLPTEAEWELAARAGTTGAFSFPTQPGWDTGCGPFPAAEPFMWWCAAGWLHGPVEAGTAGPNPWGLYDVHGNVWEWVQDFFHPGYEGAPADGSAWEDPPGNLRVIRGGAWNEPASYCRSAQRLGITPDHKCFNTGFRLVMEP